MSIDDKDIFRRIYFPYCLMKSGSGGYFILNRHYKPLGFFTSEHINYEDYPIEVFCRITKKMAAKLSYKGAQNTEAIFLYHDGTIPEGSKENMDNYLNRLKLLASLTVKSKKE